MLEYCIFYGVSMPEHFVALIKQYANLNNNDQARRVAEEISEGLQLTLSEDQSKLFFVYAPDYLEPKKSRFYSKMFDWNRPYQHMALIQRIKIMQNLTEDIEAENRLRAYFTAIKIVSSDKSFRNISSVLPAKLKSVLN